jgi:hypothetical protein
LQQKGLLKRFSINCYGKHETLEEIKENKSKKYKTLKNNKSNKEYDFYFLRYIPSDKIKKNTTRKVIPK